MKVFSVSYDLYYEDTRIIKKFRGGDTCRELHNKKFSYTLYDSYFKEDLIKSLYPRIRNTSYENMYINHKFKMTSIFLSFLRNVKIVASFYTSSSYDQSFYIQLLNEYINKYNIDARVKASPYGIVEGLYRDKYFLIEIEGRHLIYVLDTLILLDRLDLRRVEPGTDVMELLEEYSYDSSVMETSHDARKFLIYKRIIKDYLQENKYSNVYLNNPSLMYMICHKGILDYTLHYYNIRDKEVPILDIDWSFISCE